VEGLEGAKLGLGTRDSGFEQREGSLDPRQAIPKGDPLGHGCELLLSVSFGSRGQARSIWSATEGIAVVLFQSQDGRVIEEEKEISCATSFVWLPLSHWSRV